MVRTDCWIAHCKYCLRLNLPQPQRLGVLEGLVGILYVSSASLSRPWSPKITVLNLQELACIFRRCGSHGTQSPALPLPRVWQGWSV